MFKKKEIFLSDWIETKTPSGEQYTRYYNNMCGLPAAIVSPRINVLESLRPQYKVVLFALDSKGVGVVEMEGVYADDEKLAQGWCDQQLKAYFKSTGRILIDPPFTPTRLNQMIPFKVDCYD